MTKSIDQLLGDAPIYCVYMIYGRKDVLYIGRTCQLRQRLGQHLQTSEFRHRIDSVRLHLSLTKRQAQNLERRLIAKEQPPYNKILKDPNHRLLKQSNY